jgi:SAM-dependent methyltransferase
VEFVRCNLCNQDHARVRFTKREKSGITLEEFQVVECQTCGLLYVNPRPTQHEMESYYPEAYSWKETLKGDSWGMRLVRKLEKAYRYHLLKGEVSKVVNVTGRKAGRVLDVGCGTGDRLDVFRQRGFEASGVETSNSADYARDYLKLNVHKGDLLSAHFPDRFFDTVTLYHVLEHTPDPLEVCREIHRILREDGLVVVQVPNKESLQQKIFGKRWAAFDLPRDLYYFGVGTLNALLGKAGFRILKMDHFMNWIHPPTLVLSLFPELDPQKSWEREARGRNTILHRAAWGLCTVMASPVTQLESALKRGAIVTCYAVKKESLK